MPEYKYVSNSFFNPDKRCNKLTHSFIDFLMLFALILLCILTDSKLVRAAYLPTFLIVMIWFSFSCGNLSSLFGSKVFTWFSTIQMEFFILHWPIIQFFSYLPITNYYTEALLSFITTIGISLLYCKFLKKPLADTMAHCIRLS